MQNIQKDCYMCHDKKTSLTEVKSHKDKNLGESSADSVHSLSQKSQFKYSWKTVLLLSPFTHIFKIFPLNHLNSGLKLNSENQRTMHPNLSPEHMTSAPRENTVDISTSWSRQHLIQTKIIVISPF